MPDIILEPWKKPVATTDDAAREIRAVTSEKTIAANAIRLRGLTDGIKEGKRMSKLGAIAERISAKKEAHDKKADEWAVRLDALDKREPGAFAIGDAVIEERETDLADMEKTMRTLSNLPNVVSGQ
jgi:hypothetical protein